MTPLPTPLALPRLLPDWVAIALAVVLSFSAGFAVGAALTWQRAQLLHIRQAQADAARVAQRIAAIQADGQRLADELRERLAAGTEYRNTLEKRLSHATVVSRSSLAIACRAARPAAAGRVGGPGIGPGFAELATPAPADAAPDGVGGADAAGLGLTHAAVGVWNSALAGRDMPSGACPVDDPTHPACAADSGLTPEDAWANHLTNAASCAADRARLDQLITYLQRWHSPAGDRP